MTDDQFAELAFDDTHFDKRTKIHKERLAANPEASIAMAGAKGFLRVDS